MKKIIAIAMLAALTAAAQETETLSALAASQDPAAKEKAAGLAAVEQENARLSRGKSLDARQKQAVAAEKKAAHEQRMAERAATPATHVAPAVPFRGIVTAEDIPNPFRPSELTILNYWGGEVDGKPFGVYSGFRPDDPTRGVLVVFDSVENTRGTYYDAPGAPASIAAQLNGKLVLQSRASHYQFDLKTRSFD